MKYFQGEKIGVKGGCGRELCEGDKVLVNVRRLSSSHSTWYQKTNKHHGVYQLPAIIRYGGAAFYPRYLDGVCDELIKPKGTEKFAQVLQLPTSQWSEWWKECFHIGSIYSPKK